jgi:hypothetical protein
MHASLHFVGHVVHVASALKHAGCRREIWALLRCGAHRTMEQSGSWSTVICIS